MILPLSETDYLTFFWHEKVCKMRIISRAAADLILALFDTEKSRKEQRKIVVWERVNEEI